jgi:hypothetical protein
MNTEISAIYISHTMDKVEILPWRNKNVSIIYKYNKSLLDVNPHYPETTCGGSPHNCW